jgi:DNA-binding XRE family transcriptional regulator
MALPIWPGCTRLLSSALPSEATFDDVPRLRKHAHDSEPDGGVALSRGTDAETLGARLSARRHALGMSQFDLELLTGIPKARISRYENGHVVPSLPTLVILAQHLDTSIGVLAENLFLERP